MIQGLYYVSNDVAVIDLPSGFCNTSMDGLKLQNRKVIPYHTLVASDYLSILRLKLIQVSKMSPGSILSSS